MVVLRGQDFETANKAIHHYEPDEVAAWLTMNVTAFWLPMQNGER